MYRLDAQLTAKLGIIRSIAWLLTAIIGVFTVMEIGVKMPCAHGEPRLPRALVTGAACWFVLWTLYVTDRATISVYHYVQWQKQLPPRYHQTLSTSDSYPSPIVVSRASSTADEAFVDDAIPHNFGTYTIYLSDSEHDEEKDDDGGAGGAIVFTCCAQCVQGCIDSRPHVVVVMILVGVNWCVAALYVFGAYLSPTNGLPKMVAVLTIAIVYLVACAVIVWQLNHLFNQKYQQQQSRTHVRA